MNNVRFKIHLNKGELPTPRNDGLAAPIEPGDGLRRASYPTPATTTSTATASSTSATTPATTACTPRRPARASDRRTCSSPQDLLIAFSDGGDDDGNGYVDDIAGWDFLDDDNDPFDDVQYGHGSGEVQDSTAEADNGAGRRRHLPELHGRSRCGSATASSPTPTASPPRSPTRPTTASRWSRRRSGAMNNSGLARQAVDYAYKPRATVIASAADEAAQHNNWPSSLPHVIMVNSVTKYDDSIARAAAELSQVQRLHELLREDHGRDPVGQLLLGRHRPRLGHRRADLLGGPQRGRPAASSTAQPRLHPRRRHPCPITPNEVRQLMARARSAAGARPTTSTSRWTREPSCSSPRSRHRPAPTRSSAAARRCPTLLPVVAARPDVEALPGAGGPRPVLRLRPRQRLQRGQRLSAPHGDPSVKSKLPPEVEITSPDWYAQIDPTQATLDVGGQIWRAAATPYTCQVYVAPGHYPNNARPPTRRRATSSPSPSALLRRHDRCAPTASTARSPTSTSPTSSRAFPAAPATSTGREPGTGVQTVLRAARTRRRTGSSSRSSRRRRRRR